jgi:hypothetical protein
MTVTPLEQGRLLADEGIARVAQGAGPTWMMLALDAWEATCRAYGYFNTDDVWTRIHTAPKDGRAMGAVARIALLRDWCSRTGEYTLTERPQAHARPIPMYRSNLWTP